MLTNQSLLNLFDRNEKRQTICLDSDWKSISKETSTNPNVTLSSTNLAYVIYTSGSTGEPKGTLLEHKGLCNLVEWYKTKLHITENDHSSQFASAAFDTFGCEVWPFLSVGAFGSIIDDLTRYSPEKLKQWLIDHDITITDLPAVLADTLLQSTWPKETALRILKAGGEKITRFPANYISFEVMNTYGPTEATIECTAAWINANKGDSNLITPPIGKPIINTCAYVLEPTTLVPVPIGVPGELFIGGVGLARGYLNNENLTEQKFINNPFATGKLYKTGDRVRWLSNGELEYIDRVDKQVKIRGFRIELSEIEARLEQHPAIQNAVVVINEKQGEKYLVAYWVCCSDMKTSINELRKYAKTTSLYGTASLR